MSTTMFAKEQEGVVKLILSAPVLLAFIGCRGNIKEHAKKLVQTIVDEETDEEDRYLAAVTLNEVLFLFETFANTLPEGF